jgi:ABC-2 type transport system permease protein
MSLITELKELYRYRELLLMLVQRDLKVRYKNTWAGFAWSLINPALQVAVMTVVLKFVLRVDIQNYSMYLFCAFLPWSFFQLGLLDASTSLLFNERLMRKIYFPREVIPLSLVISNLVHLVMATLVFFAILVALPFFWWPFTHQFVWTLQPTALLVPVAILIEFLLVAGLAFFVSALNLFYEDVRYLLTVGLSMLYYAVPVLYFAEFLLNTSAIRPEWRQPVYTLYMLNPLAAIITAFRKWILPPTNSPMWGRAAWMPGDWWFVAAAAASSLLIAAAGYSYFNHRKWNFAERA